MSDPLLSLADYLTGLSLRKNSRPMNGDVRYFDVVTALCVLLLLHTFRQFAGNFNAIGQDHLI